MAELTTIFSDVGGVFLTNGWDRDARAHAVEKFHLDAKAFEERHQLILDAFESGRASLEEYLDRTVFCEPRSFSREEFKAFLYAQSQPCPDTLELLGRLARSRKYFLSTLNNESFELNEYRIKQFRLRDYFEIFLSSCYLGARKPEEGIYRLALRITQRNPQECLFLDDRASNLEPAARLGMRTIHYQNPGQLLQELREHGVSRDSG